MYLKSKIMQKLRDQMARDLYGMTVKEATACSICIDCQDDIDIHSLSDVDWREYCISGLCPECFENTPKRTVQLDS